MPSRKKIRLKANTFLILLGILIVPCLYPQQQTKVGGMSLTHRLVDDRVEFTLTAPTLGWLGIGFNNRNSIVGSDLYLLHVVDGKLAGQDMYVKGAGDPRLDSTLGGTHDLKLISGKEEDGQTTIVFSLPLVSADKNDFQLEVGKEMWLILAYSTHDEFDHHSRMRKHIRYTVSN